MRHHKRIKSLISRRVDDSIIGLDNSWTATICEQKRSLDSGNGKEILR